MPWTVNRVLLLLAAACLGLAVLGATGAAVVVWPPLAWLCWGLLLWCVAGLV